VPLKAILYLAIKSTTTNQQMAVKDGLLGPKGGQWWLALHQDSDCQYSSFIHHNSVLFFSFLLTVIMTFIEKTQVTVETQMWIDR